MAEVLMIQIGDAGKGGWWYAIDEQQAFGDGYSTEAAAIEAAAAFAGAAPYEIWYACQAEGKTVTVPGPRSANHPEGKE